MIEGPKGGDLFIVDNSISGWTGLRYHGSTGHSERGVSTIAQLSFSLTQLKAWSRNSPG